MNKERIKVAEETIMHIKDILNDGNEVSSDFLQFRIGIIIEYIEFLKNKEEIK